MRRTALAALCLAAAATAGLSGCLPGQDKADSKPKGPFAGLTGGEIADRALKATTGASSLRLKGDVADDESNGTIQLDMALNKKGECAGTMSMGGQGKADLIKTGDTVYMKYDEAFLRAQSKGESKADTDAAVAMLAGKWTKMAVKGQDAKDIASFCDLDTVLGGAADVNSDATRGRTTTVDGTPAIVLHEKDGKDQYTLYVATEGKPYLLKIDSTSAKDPVHLTLDDYNQPVPAKKPAGKILDLDALGG
ncbi:hypothetical protein [Streptomyces sp. HUAS TT20]|uniref:hypothetical protein n=1 Tax=Streptomyces sp. HUAS TT20 TaxID=3447509 RepID=UPI0021D96E7A|nr:hypothetical protein [Streptomyces sp. HUAS 15-9]UXY28021.1 hypothetical protein N8I87_16550 [Streptomyces sp. HUAS 15-9]